MKTLSTRALLMALVISLRWRRPPLHWRRRGRSSMLRRKGAEQSRRTGARREGGAIEGRRRACVPQHHEGRPGGRRRSTGGCCVAARASPLVTTTRRACPGACRPGAQQYGYAMFFHDGEGAQSLDSSEGFRGRSRPERVVVDSGMAEERHLEHPDRGDLRVRLPRKKA